MKRLPLEYFEKLYAEADDPWGFESRWYEARKYALTLASLPRERYARAFEPGCSLGVLTAHLALRCDALVAAEPVAKIAARARERVRAQPHVAVRELSLPEGWPEGPFDLVVLSEVLYYLDVAGVAEVLARIDGSLTEQGHVLAVHWTGETDYPQSGAAVHAHLERHPRWTKRLQHDEREFVLAVFEKNGAP